MSSPSPSSSSLSCDLSIIFWNVRNLSHTISRQGVRGNGFPLYDRAVAIASGINKYQPDMLFLLEMGADGEDVVKTIAAKLSSSIYHFRVTTQTGEETYALIYNSKTIAINKYVTCGTNPDYRQGALFYFTHVPSGRRHTALVLHAPFKSNPSDVIIDVLADAYQKNDGKIPDLYLGDFNTKQQVLNQLISDLNKHNVSLLGPKGATSLKTFRNINRYGSSDSECYDLCWTSNDFQKLCRNGYCDILTPSVLLPKLKDQFISFLDDMVNTACELTNLSSGASTRSASNPVTLNQTPFPAGLQEIGNALGVLKQQSQTITLSKNFAPKKWQNQFEKVYESLKSVTGTLTPIQFERLMADVTCIQEALACLLAFIANHAEENAEQLIDTILLAYGISDHCPVSVRLSWLPPVFNAPSDPVTGSQSQDMQDDDGSQSNNNSSNGDHDTVMHHTDNKK